MGEVLRPLTHRGFLKTGIWGDLVISGARNDGIHLDTDRELKSSFSLFLLMPKMQILSWEST